MKTRIIIIVSAALIVCALVCCITEKQLVIEIVLESSIPSDLAQTDIGVSEYYINGKKSATDAEQKEIAAMCSKSTQNAIREKIKETFSSDSEIIFEGKAVYFDDKGHLFVYYYFDFLYCDDSNFENMETDAEIGIGPKVAKVTFERKSIVLSAIFGE